MTTEDKFKILIDAIVDGEEKIAIGAIKDLLNDGIAAKKIIDDGIIIIPNLLRCPVLRLANKARHNRNVKNTLVRLLD